MYDDDDGGDDDDDDNDDEEEEEEAEEKAEEEADEDEGFFHQLLEYVHHLHNGPACSASSVHVTAVSPLCSCSILCFLLCANVARLQRHSHVYVPLKSVNKRMRADGADEQ